jgi:hypothetical protein
VVIDDLSEEGLIDDELYIGWKNLEMNDYEMIQLDSGQNENEYVAYIPTQLSDTEVHYYVHAVDYSGREEYLPMAGYFSFDAIGGSPTQQGDINMDDVVNILDVVLMVNHILNLADLSDYQVQLADMNQDGIVNILDVITLVNSILEG